MSSVSSRLSAPMQFRSEKFSSEKVRCGKYIKGHDDVDEGSCMITVNTYLLYDIVRCSSF